MTVLGFRLAAATNIAGVLTFSWFFSNTRLIELSPVVFSRFGLLCVMLWGLAYLAVATSYQRVPALIGVFALEKLIYVATWIVWMREHGSGLQHLFAEAPLTAMFYLVYGPLDFLFGAFFAVVAWRAWRAPALAPMQSAR